MQRKGQGKRIWGFLSMLVLASLACNAPGAAETNTEVTVAAVYATITAQAATAGVPTTPPPEGRLTAAGPSPSATSEREKTPTPSPTPPESRAENGENLTVRRCARSIVVDGDRADWEPLAGVARFQLEAATYGAARWSGATDLSGEVWACWTDSVLNLFASVTDDAHVQTESGSTAWKGDEVEIVFDGDLRGDFYTEVWNDDDAQIGLSPGDFADLPPSAVQYRPSARDAPEIDVAARRPIESGGNYALEAAIPWSVLGVAPEGGTSYGFCVALSDNDQVGAASQDSMVSNCPNLLVSDPTTWATITLGE